MFMKKLILLLLLFALYGCSEKEVEVLSPPTNISFNTSNNTISWTPVQDVLSYVLSINGQTIELDANSYVINVPSGRYEIKVRAKYATGLSRYTVPIFIDVIKNETLNYQVSEQLSFDEVPGASSYKLEIYNTLNEKVFDEEITSPFDLEDRLGNLRFELKAYYQSSVIASEVFFINFQGLTYTKDTLDLVIQCCDTITEMYLNDDLVSSEYYSQAGNDVIINAAYLDLLESDVYILKTVGSFTTYQYLTITAYERPVLISNSQQVFNNSDISFTFDLKGGSFEGLAATPQVTLADYSFTEQTLVISKAYFEAIKSSNPTRDKVIFSYVISNGPYTVIGYLTVNLST